MPTPIEAQPSAAPRPPRRWLGTLIAVIGLAALAALAWYLTHRPAEPAANGMPPGAGAPGPRGGGFGGARGGALASTVAVAAAARADVPVLLDSLGTVTPAATVIVRPQVSGVLSKVLFTEGQMVNKGQLLAQIDPRPFELALMQATGSRERDEAQLQNARLTLERYRTLLQQDSIARQDVDTQAALVKQLEGTVMTDRANEGTAKLNVEYTRIVAPVAGRVGLRSVDAGNLVSTSDTNGVALITQLAPIDVLFTIPQDRVQEVLQRLAGGALPARAFDRTRSTLLDAGQFATLDNQVDTTTGTVKGKARFANAKGLLFPSQFVNVQLELSTIAGAVVVPVSAVRNGAAGDFVYVLNDDKTVSQRNVKRGPATPERVVIAAGLQPGERVVTEGADRLKDGASVQLAADVASAPGRAASRPWRGASGAASGPGGASGPRRRDRAASETAP
jgi:multidrug efflux system membrane fusion protein